MSAINWSGINCFLNSGSRLRSSFDEHAHDYVAHLDLPGVEPSDISVRVTSYGARLQIFVGESEEPVWQFPFPVDAVVEAVTARVRLGVLRITLPRTPVGAHRNIPVIAG